MRWCAALLLALFVVVAPRRAHAQSGPRLGAGLLLMQPELASSQFSGSGVPYTSHEGVRQSFDHSGRQLGVHAPVVVGAELRLSWEERLFEIGVQGFGGGALGDSGGASDPGAAELAKASSMHAYGGGIHAVLAIPAGVVTFLLGPDLGVRAFSVPLTGFEPTTCAGKYGAYSCPETATSTQPYVAPRLTVVIHGDRARGGGFFFAPWAGLDVLPSPSWAAGFSFGFGYDHTR